MCGWRGKMYGGGVRCLRVEMLRLWVEGQYICKLD